MGKNIAMLLCGCGYLDGSEIHESTLCLLHIDMNLANFKCFAPDIPQCETVNHLSKEKSDEERNALVESARIARSEISPFSSLSADHFDALIIPGGFGIAKTLSDFASNSENCTVHKETELIISQFIDMDKPILGTCIAPVLIARVLENKGLSAKITLGPNEVYKELLDDMGMIGISTSASEFIFDAKNNIYTTAAYMDESASIFKLHKGIGAAIAQMLS
jgi:enhancing lycopene biosynthesis protein 2